jgi:hypothetical protein
MEYIVPKLRREYMYRRLTDGQDKKLSVILSVLNRCYSSISSVLV